MSKKGYEEMVGRAITDSEFRSKLLDDPKKTLAAEGYDVSGDIVSKLEAIDNTAAEAAVKDLEVKLGDQKAAL